MCNYNEALAETCGYNSYDDIHRKGDKLVAKRKLRSCNLSDTIEEEADAAAQWLAKAERLLPVIIPGQTVNYCFN